jgi:hypothetical protein
MTPVECRREPDVLDALATGRWTAHRDAELAAHVAGCPMCADLVAVVEPLMAERDGALAAVQVPAAGTVWWRAQTRARREAAREAARPVTVAQAVGALAALAACAALLWLAMPWLPDVRALLPDLPALPGLPAISLNSPEWIGGDGVARWRWVIAAGLAWLVLAPLAIYFAILED